MILPFGPKGSLGTRRTFGLIALLPLTLVYGRTTADRLATINVSLWANNS